MGLGFEETYFLDFHLFVKDRWGDKGRDFYCFSKNWPPNLAERKK